MPELATNEPFHPDRLPECSFMKEQVENLQGAHCTAEDLIIPVNASRSEVYRILVPQLRAFVAPEGDLVANLANVAAVLNTALKPHWVGFYIMRDGELVLGPYQGPLACSRISLSQGVCGASARAKETIIVPNVDEFPGHIACSSKSRSEIVVPLLSAGEVRLVLDIDSVVLADFSEIDRKGLEAVVDLLRGRHFEQASLKQKVFSYLDRTGLLNADSSEPSYTAIMADMDRVEEATSRYQEIVRREINSASRLIDGARADLFTYLVPLLTADGSCSIAKSLDPVPYDLDKVLGGHRDEAWRFLKALQGVLEYAQSNVKPDWLGIYKRFESAKESPKLVKLSYHGKPSRAEFPLTKEFAASSNNSSVGLTGKGVVISSVSRHLDSGKPFYVCDSEVNSEVCLPIFSRNGHEITGIVDAEAFAESFFDTKGLSELCGLCIALSDLLE